MATRLSTIELHKESMKFSSGHFTILTPQKRERLHGHNFMLHVAITTHVAENGMSFDYRFYKEKLHKLCRELNECFLIPGTSPYARVEETEEHCYIHFNNEVIPFLRKDVVILPVNNITVEELSHWFILRLTDNAEELKNHAIVAITTKVFTGPGQSGTSYWTLA